MDCLFIQYLVVKPMDPKTKQKATSICSLQTLRYLCTLQPCLQEERLCTFHGIFWQVRYYTHGLMGSFTFCIIISP